MFVAVCGDREFVADSVREIYSLTKGMMDKCVYSFEGDYIKQIVVEVRYVDNLLAHFFVSHGFNYTFGFPEDKLFRLDDLSGFGILKDLWWHLSSLVMYLEPKTFKDLKRVLWDIYDFLVLDSNNYIDDARRMLYGVFENGFVNKLRSNYDLDALLTRLIDSITRHNEKYREYWRGVENRLREIAMRQEGIINASGLIDIMRDVVGFNKEMEIKGIPFDVFRKGGGLYGVMRRDLSRVSIGLSSSRESTLMCIVEASYGLGHPFTHFVLNEFGEEISLIVKALEKHVNNYPIGIYVVSEVVTIAYQITVTKRIFREPIPTHGWHYSKNVAYISRRAEFDEFKNVVKAWLERVRKDYEYFYELISLAKSLVSGH